MFESEPVTNLQQNIPHKFISLKQTPLKEDNRLVSFDLSKEKGSRNLMPMTQPLSFADKSSFFKQEEPNLISNSTPKLKSEYASAKLS